MDIKLLISFLTLIPLSLCSWSAWPRWSACTHTCGGGLTHRTRQCLADDAALCVGHAVEYKVCRSRACPTGTPSTREAQCTSYNTVPHSHALYTWLPDTDRAHPCVLRCRALERDLTVVLAEKVIDGTKCTSNSKAMCIDGACVPVGCDNEVGSNKRRDKCGICGGDGSTCTNQLDQSSVEIDQILPVKQQRYNHPHAAGHIHSISPDVDAYKADAHKAGVGLFDYQSDDAADVLPVLTYADIPTHLWQETAFSECSVTCGLGIERSTIVCKHSRTRDVVDDVNCAGARKPGHRERVCDTGETCTNSRWSTGVWTECSASCGGGLASRPVYCVQYKNNGGFDKVNPEQCLGDIPEARRRCHDFPCPTWHPGPWSLCSVTCDAGEQYREVVCKRLTEDADCDAVEKPAARQQCHTGVICVRTLGGTRHPELDNHIVVDNTVNAKPDKPQKVDYDVSRGDDYSYGEFRESPSQEWADEYRGYGRISALDFDYESVGYRDLEYNGNDLVDKLGIGKDYDYRGNDVMASHDGSGEVLEIPWPSPSYRLEEPSFVASRWADCSATCGHGVRRRFVQCKVFIAYTNTFQELHDSRCTGPKPAAEDSCIMPNCPVSFAAQEGPRYAWQSAGYQACSATCGQGFRTLLFYCVRHDKGGHVQVDESLCSVIARPSGVLKQTCNEFQCPASLGRKEPRWRTYSYGVCSHPCGGGTVQRQVDCIVDVGGEGQVDRVPDALCRAIGLASPSRTKLCNQVPCQPTWSEGELSACSATCGQGYRTRQVLCRRVTPPSREVQIMHDEFCSGEKPADRIPCTAQQVCRKRVRINADTSHYVQLQKREQLRLVAGGTAVIIPGAVLRIRCPVRNFPREDVTWTKEGVAIGQKGRVKISKRGVLHIRSADTRHQGIYTCHANNASATVTLSFHSYKEAVRKYVERDWARDQTFLSSFRQQITEYTNRKEEFTEPYLSKHFDRYDLPYEFVTSPWGDCTRSCGGAGLQSRAVNCELNFDKYYLVVDDDNCYGRGQDRPLATRDCGFEQCPVWEEGQYQQCSDSYCLGPGTGSRVRPLFCIAPHNGTQVPLSKCDAGSRPVDKLPCPKETCVPTWIESDWTQCSKTCGGPGFRTRSLLCVWVPDKRPANGDCNGLIKPEVIKPCDTPACPQNTECRGDESTYCSMVEMLNFCRYPEYRTKCCRSCNQVLANRYRFRH